MSEQNVVDGAANIVAQIIRMVRSNSNDAAWYSMTVREVILKNFTHADALLADKGRTVDQRLREVKRIAGRAQFFYGFHFERL